jgi:hypothetical protein
MVFSSQRSTVGGIEVNGMMSITTGTVIPTPKEARMRQMISSFAPLFFF